MKKLLLSVFAGSLAMGAVAQNAAKSVVFNNSGATTDRKESRAPKPAGPRTKRPAQVNTANKGTAMQQRWFSYFDAVDALNDGKLGDNFGLTSIWFDSTIVVNYTTGGPGPVNYSSAAVVMDPVSNDQLFDNPDIFSGEPDLTAVMPYTVDSVSVLGSYIRNINRPGDIVDTLIFSVAPSSGQYSIDKTDPDLGTDVAPYLPGANDTTLYGITQLNVDSVNRCLESDITGTNRIMWKVPITAADGDTADVDGLVSVSFFTFAVPGGGLQMPAGESFAVSVTFKSGDTWTPNVDTLAGMHRFTVAMSEVTAGARMPYYFYTLGDRNMGNLMFSTDPSRYLPTVLIEAINTPSFSNEFIALDAHLTWDDAGAVGTVASSFNASAYPNPASNVVNIPVTMKQNGSVTVSMANGLGQQVGAQNLGNVNAGATATATFNTTGFASGVYFYTVEVNGTRKTQRVVIR